MNYRPTKGPLAAEAFPFAMPLAALTLFFFAVDWDGFGIVTLAALVFVLAFSVTRSATTSRWRAE